jgi:hypothetical protein
MTKTELERLAVVESKQDRANSDIQEIKHNQESNHNDLAARITALTLSIDGRILDHETRLKGAEETLEPFTKFKRKLWSAVVFSLLTLAVALIVLVESQRIK